MEGTFNGHLVQTLCHMQGQFLLGQVAQSLIQLDTKLVGISKLFQFLTTLIIKKNILPYIQSKLDKLFQFKTIIPSHVTTGPSKMSFI